MNRPSSTIRTVLPGGLVLRTAVPADLRETAGQHVRLLPVGLFPHMGPRFLRRWHRTFLRIAHGIAFVVVDPARDQKVVGFLLGSTDQAAHMDALLRDRRSIIELVAAGSVALLVRPHLAVKFLRTRGRAWLRRVVGQRMSVPSGVRVNRPPSVAVLSAIAVEPHLRGQGVGAHLVRHFIAEARASGSAVAELVTEAGSAGAGGLYERLGWRAAGERVTRDGTMVCTYGYVLTDAPPVAGVDDAPTIGGDQ